MYHNHFKKVVSLKSYFVLSTKETEMTIPLFLGLFPAYVFSELVPGNNVNFITRAGYKYIGEPEVMIMCVCCPSLKSLSRKVLLLRVKRTQRLSVVITAFSTRILHSAAMDTLWMGQLATLCLIHQNWRKTE